MIMKLMLLIARAARAFGLTIAFAVPASAVAPFSFDAAPGRLPKNVAPIDYDVAVVPDAEALTFDGTESVRLRFRSATATIVFNSLNETLRDVRLDGRPAESVKSDDEQQLTTVTLVAPASPGLHRLTFSYTGKIETQPRGLFRQSYARPGGGEGMMLSTKMESTEARRMFPCWDEPAFRATFELTVTTLSKWTTIANMPIAKRTVHGGLATTIFQRSPRMPTYLVELTAGDLAALSAKSGATQLSVWADRGREKDGATALANAQQILADYNEYFGFRYPLPKLDSIAVPGGFGGAMENWGAITYNDQLLLLTPRSTIVNRQYVYSVQAHEMAHQWNGDLVTMGWWDDLWLNESFASWRAAKQTDLRNPDWKWWEREDSTKEDAMHADSFAVSHAIQQHVTDELQAANAFDPEITYNKGQAVLRMFEAYLGENVFRDGIRRYIKARAYSNATSADLWNALSAASGKNVAEITSGWIERAGYPLVDVAAVCDPAGNRTITLSQHRFMLRGTDPAASHWSIPVRIRSGVDGAPQSLLLTRDGQTASAGRCGEPLSLNPDAIGYYRVRFDAPTFDTNLKYFARLRNGDKISLLDDQWALVGSGTENLGSYLSIVSSMGLDLDTRIWQQIAGALATIEYDERETAGHDAFAAYARSIIQPVADRLGWDSRPGETPDVMELRRTLIRSLGVWGDEGVIEEARKRFGAFAKDHNAVQPDDQRVMLSIVARHADEATFDRLHSIAKQAKDETEQQRYFLSLMEVGDSQLAMRAAEIAMSTEIPPQGARWRLSLVVRLASQHHELAWATFSRNVETLMEPHTKYAPLITAQYVPEYFWDCLPLDQLETWVRAHVPAEMSSNIAHGMETARFNRSEKETLVPAADAYVRGVRGVTQADARAYRTTNDLHDPARRARSTQ
jgi:aminopeptidase N